MSNRRVGGNNDGELDPGTNNSSREGDRTFFVLTEDESQNFLTVEGEGVAAIGERRAEVFQRNISTTSGISHALWFDRCRRQNSRKQKEHDTLRLVFPSSPLQTQPSLQIQKCNSAAH